MYIEELNKLHEKKLFEMANISSKETGLPYDLWLDSLGVKRNTEHNSPRVKVSVDGELIPIEISDNPDIPKSARKNGAKDFKDIELVKKYIKAYKDIFLAHYNNLITDKDALNLLGSLKDYEEAKLKLADMLDTQPNLRIDYFWSTQDLLYIIEVKSDKGIIENAYALTDNDLFIKLSELKDKYTIDTINITQTK